MQEISLLDGEIQGNRKSNNEMQEKNEKLTVELQMAQIQCEAIKRTINKKKEEEEVLLAQYSSYQGSLKEAENTLLHLKKVVRTYLRTTVLTLYNVNLSFIITGSQRCPVCAKQSKEAAGEGKCTTIRFGG